MKCFYTIRLHRRGKCTPLTHCLARNTCTLVYPALICKCVTGCFAWSWISFKYCKQSTATSRVKLIVVCIFNWRISAVAWSNEFVLHQSTCARAMIAQEQQQSVWTWKQQQLNVDLTRWRNKLSLHEVSQQSPSHRELWCHRKWLFFAIVESSGAAHLFLLDWITQNF